MTKRNVTEVEILSALHIAKGARGALERSGGSWSRGVKAEVVAELLRRDLVALVACDGRGAPRHVELNVRGQDLIAEAQQLAHGGAA